MSCVASLSLVELCSLSFSLCSFLLVKPWNVAVARAVDRDATCTEYSVVHIFFGLNARCRVCTHRLRIFVGYTDLTNFGVLHKFSVCGSFVYSALPSL